MTTPITLRDEGWLASHAANEPKNGDSHPVKNPDSGTSAEGFRTGVAPLDTVTPQLPGLFRPDLMQTQKFIPEHLEINSWQDIKPYFDEFLSRNIGNAEQLQKLVLDFNELVKVVDEAYAWAYIMNSRYTDNKEYEARLTLFDKEIIPEYEKASNDVEEKIAQSEWLAALPDARYGQYKKLVRHSLEMFREENVPLDAELAQMSTEYGALVGGLKVTVNGKEMTIQQAQALTRSPDRAVREEAWFAIHNAYKAVKPQLDGLFDRMLPVRHQVALNAGFQNYRDYKHKDRKRFDYTVADTQELHQAVKEHVVPLAKVLYHKHRERLGLPESEFRPWDAHWRNLSALPGEKPLTPFESADELKENAVKVFGRLKPEFGANLRTMDQAGLFDLESRPNKQPGGYNYPLLKTGMPFIFMNAAGTHGDVETMMHEGGHAVHTFLTAGEPLVYYQDTPSEMAETASMAMELLTMPLWDGYYSDPADHQRAMREHLESIILFLPWGVVVDAFQQWIYTHPDHTVAERDAKFKELMREYGLLEQNWDGLEDYMANDFLRQSHIFTLPFYYLEYVIAQLGSLQIYRNMVADPDKALDGYVRGLSLGYSKPLPEIWNEMGIKFDFSAGTITELMAFVQERLGELG